MSAQKARRERIPQYDLIRAAAMFLVVYVHSSFAFEFALGNDSKQAGLFWFTTVIALVCNALFFMVSGKFNLAQTTKLELGGYRNFYTKKIINLLLPVAVYAVAFWVLKFVGIKFFGAWDEGTGFWDLKAFLKMIHELLMSSWWFVPMIFSLMIFTPFLGRLAKSLKQKELYVLLGLLFGCAAVIALEKMIGQTMAISKFLAPTFGIWAGVYVLGYVIDQPVFSAKVIKRWYAAAGAVIAVFGFAAIFIPQYFFSSAGDPTPAWSIMLSAVFYPVAGVGLFLFFKNVKISGDKTKQAVEFIGNRAFGIYLIHFCFLFSFLQLLPDWLRGADTAISGIADRLIITVLIYVASLAVATFLDLLVVNPAQKKLLQIFK